MVNTKEQDKIARLRASSSANVGSADAPFSSRSSEDESSDISETKENDYVKSTSGIYSPKKAKHSRTRVIPWLTILAYCAPCVGAGGMTFTLTTFTAYFYTDTLGLTPGIVGVIEIILMLMYAISEPIFGWLSDITTGGVAKYLGRRKPYLAVSSVLHAGAFYCVVSPPSFLSGNSLENWALSCVLILGMSWGCNEVVFQGLGSQLTFDYDERTKLQAVVVGMITIGSTTCGVLHGVLGQTLGSEGPANRTRFMVIALVYASFFLVGNLILLFYVREETITDDNVAQQLVSVQSFGDWVNDGINSVKEMFLNMPFNMLMATYSLALTAGAVTPMMMPYFAKHIVQSQVSSDWAPLLYTGSAVIGMPLWVFLGGPIVGLEKKSRFILAASWLTLFLCLSALLIHAGDTLQMNIFSMMGGLAFGGYFATPEAMKPDVVDYDEFRTGARHEARFAGIWMFAANTCAGIGLQVTLFILNSMGYDGSRPAGDQPPKALLTIRLAYGCVLAILFLFMFIALLFYPINRKRHEEIISATHARLSGEHAPDPLYGGPPLPPYERVPLILPVPEKPKEAEVQPWIRQVEQQIGTIATLHGGRESIRNVP